MSGAAHCDACAHYEEQTMAGNAEGLEPCPEFQMSPGFRDWVVAQMRSEVMGQVSAAGLDRMALLKGDGDDEGSGSR